MPDRTFAIDAAEIDDVAGVIPPFLLGCCCSAPATSFSLLICFPLFNSPNAIATSAESLQVRDGRDFMSS